MKILLYILAFIGSCTISYFCVQMVRDIRRFSRIRASKDNSKTPEKMESQDENKDFGN